MDYQEKITKMFEIIFGLTLIIFGTFALYHSFNMNPILNYKEYEFDLRLKPSDNFDIEDVNYIFNLDKNLLNLTF